MRDSQRQACYDWENKLAKLYPSSNLNFTLEGASQLIVRICKDEHFPLPSLSDGRGRRKACYSPSSLTIKLPRWARTPLVVCHEVAHYLTNPTGKDSWHSPAFASTVARLWGKYAGIPRAEAMCLGMEQRPRKVKFA